jgi:anti-sigma factor RsiW
MVMHPDELVINDYVDGALPPGERESVERHVAGCGECRQLVDDLRAIRRQTAALRPMEPPSRVWAGIERSLSQKKGPYPFFRGVGGKRGTAPYWLAVAAMFVIATAVGTRFIMSSRQAPGGAGTTAAATGRASGTPAAPADSADMAKSVEDDLLQAEQHYQRAIAGLEQIANADKGALDPHTAATLQKNLSVIDSAISESRAALKAQPTSEPAQASLLDSFRTKIGLLEDTVALINEMRKGNDAGAAQIVSGLKQKS